MVARSRRRLRHVADLSRVRHQLFDDLDHVDQSPPHVHADGRADDRLMFYNGLLLLA